MGTTTHEHTARKHGTDRESHDCPLTLPTPPGSPPYRNLRPSATMSIMEYNGAAVVAMVGKDCVAIASDRRFGVQAQTVTCDFQKIFKMEDHVYIGLAGLATDVQTLAQRLRFRLNLY